MRGENHHQRIVCFARMPARQKKYHTVASIARHENKATTREKESSTKSLRSFTTSFPPLLSVLWYRADLKNKVTRSIYFLLLFLLPSDNVQHDLQLILALLVLVDSAKKTSKTNWPGAAERLGVQASPSLGFVDSLALVTGDVGLLPPPPGSSCKKFRPGP